MEKTNDTGSLIRSKRGFPALMIDGSPVIPAYLWTTTPEPDRFEHAAAVREFARAGMHLYAFDMGDAEWPGPAPLHCTRTGKEGHFDFSCLKDRLNRVLDADPDAHFHLRMHLEKIASQSVATCPRRYRRSIFGSLCQVFNRFAYSTIGVTQARHRV